MSSTDFRSGSDDSLSEAGQPGYRAVAVSLHWPAERMPCPLRGGAFSSLCGHQAGMSGSGVASLRLLTAGRIWVFI